MSELRLHQIIRLLRIVKQSTLPKTEHVKRNYEHEAKYFKKTLGFCLEIRLLFEQNKKIFFSTRINEDLDDIGWRNKVLDNLLAHKTSWTNRLQDYISNFSIGEIDSSQVTRSITSKEKEVRNLAIELGIVIHNHQTKTYYLCPEFSMRWARLWNNASLISPETLAKKHFEQEKIGWAAEHAVIEYETSRLGQKLKKYIDHISLSNVRAGYDILSLTKPLNGKGNPMPRLIEVKAVSPTNYRFYWSDNEIKAANHFKHWYFLYLVPINCSGKPELKMLKQISNPYHEVIMNKEEWITEQQSVCCQLKKRKEL